MYSLQYINAINTEKTQEAKKAKLQPFIAEVDGDIRVNYCPFLANYLPEGYEIVNTFFVDSSGLGRENELALTFKQFLTKVKRGFGYAIAEAGQFQLYINEYKKI